MLSIFYKLYESNINLYQFLSIIHQSLSAVYDAVYSLLSIALTEILAFNCYQLLIPIGNQFIN